MRKVVINKRPMEGLGISITVSVCHICCYFIIAKTLANHNIGTKFLGFTENLGISILLTCVGFWLGLVWFALTELLTADVENNAVYNSLCWTGTTVVDYCYYE